MSRARAHARRLAPAEPAGPPRAGHAGGADRGHRAADLHAPADQPAPAVTTIAPRPILLIAGEPERVGDRHLRDAGPGNVELWELPDTPHVGGLARHPAEWESRVTGFLDQALAPIR